MTNEKWLEAAKPNRKNLFAGSRLIQEISVRLIEDPSGARVPTFRSGWSLKDLFE